MIRRATAFIDAVLPPLTFFTMAAALYLVFIYVPTEQAQGIVQRIFYFHVPIAMMTYCSVGTVALFSVLYLWRGDRVWDRIAHAGGELAVLFCSLVLITGPIWARPIWGVAAMYVNASLRKSAPGSPVRRCSSSVYERSFTSSLVAAS
jgi:heme exporter protein C